MDEVRKVNLVIPNLGEAEETEIIEINVKIGDKVALNDPLIVLESEKAAMEVPSDYSGVIKELNVKEGEQVKEGSVYGVIEVLEENTKTEESEDIKSEELPKEIKEVPSKAHNTQHVNETSYSLEGINAGPAVRKICRELEINLRQIVGTGKNGMVTKDDLKNFIHSNKNAKDIAYADLDKLKNFGDYVIENQSKIRKLAAKNLLNSWNTIPHVTHFEEIDISYAEEQRAVLYKDSKVKVTPLAYLIEAIVSALKEFPIFNSSLVGDGELMLRNYINIGIAVDTEQGLVVPVIKNTDNFSVKEIAEKITELAAKAKQKKLMKDDLEGATFTVSSLGPLGGTGFSQSLILLK